MKMIQENKEKYCKANSNFQYGVILELSASDLTQGTMGFHTERDGSQYNH